MTEIKNNTVDYPTTLDVVKRDGKEYQVVAMAQTGKHQEDVYLLKDPESGETHRVKGARFNPTTTSKPGRGNIHRREEGVRITGTLDGGLKQD
jgi:hypothetical protein